MVQLTVVGAGAIGMLLTARLVGAGYEVELVTRREDQATLLKETGLLLTGGGTSYPSVRSIDERAAAASNDEHFILLAVKQTAMSNALAERVKAMMGPNSRVVCWQNGIGHERVLEKHMEAERIWLTVTTEGALKVSDTEVSHTGCGVTWLGPMIPGEADAEASQKNLQQLLKNAGFEVFLSNEIMNRVWQKLLINAVINPLTALLQVNNGDLPGLPEARPVMRALFEEAYDLALKLGIRLEPELWEMVLDVCRRTRDNRSSMLQDVLAGRQTEIEAINGALLRMAGEAGISMPTHWTIFRLVKALEGASPARG